jgi:NADH:ubiquinone oxidoreductase subunit E
MENDFKEQLDDILSQYNRNRDNLIPILQEVQQRFGYLPEEAMQGIADFLRLSNSTVYSVSTFYAQFKFTPTGKRTVKVCRGTACHVRGGASLLRDIERRLGIKPGETTEDLEYTLETVACVGACALAPLMIINDEVYGRMTTTDVGKALGNYRADKEAGMES